MPRQQTRDALGGWRDYDFVEVGTSDWGTLTQYCAGDHSIGSLFAAEIRTSLDSLRAVTGIAVEAVQEHMESLPSLPRVAKMDVMSRWTR